MHKQIYVYKNIQIEKDQQIEVELVPLHLLHCFSIQNIEILPYGFSHMSILIIAEKH